MSPIFSYSCPHCGSKFDKFVRKMDEDPVCIQCGKPVKKVWSTPAPAIWNCSKGSL